jgi:arsenate reductase
VVTVCDDANEECPVWLGKGKRVHKSFRDPATVKGTEEEKLSVFREIRDEILKNIPELLN